MKKLFLICLTFLIALPFALGVSGDAKRLAIARGLYGKIRVVNVGEHYKVRVVNGGADLKVRLVNGLSFDVGQWKFVTHGEDFKIRFVNLGEDLKIRYVNIGEGIDR